MEPNFKGPFDHSKYQPRRDNSPRVLLRGWHPGTAAAAVGLNTDRGIYPFAWKYHVRPPSTNRLSREEPFVAPPRLTDLSKGEVLALAAVHISGDHEPLSPFSSWTADLPTAIFFGMGEFQVRGWAMSPEPGQIAVMDLARPHPIIHTTDLGWLNLPMEYLVHGPVTEGLRVVPIASIRTALNCPLWPFCHRVRREPHPVTDEEIRDSVRFGLLFLSPADAHVDVAVILAAYLLAWGQVPVASPKPLSEEDLARAERQTARPWPAADLERILTSGLLVHGGACPPLSGAFLANSLTNTVGAPQLELTLGLLTRMQEAWGPAGDDAAGATGRPRLTRREWEAAFRAAAVRDAPIPHTCGPFVCKNCGKSRAGPAPTDFLKPTRIYFCTNRCHTKNVLKENIERAKAGTIPQ